MARALSDLDEDRRTGIGAARLDDELAAILRAFEQEDAPRRLVELAADFQELLERRSRGLKLS
jgi:hypothetical protein